MLEHIKKYKRHFAAMIIIVSGVYVLFPKGETIKNIDYESKIEDKTIIIVATMHRVGSTKIFNAIKKIHEVLGEECHSGFIDHTTISRAYDYHNPSKVHIVKLHNPADFTNNEVIANAYNHKLKNFSNDDSKKIYWITAKRDLRDIAASQVRVGKFYPYFYNIRKDDFLHIAKALHANLSWYYAYRDISDYEVDYEEFIERPYIVIQNIAHAIGKNLDDQQVQKVKEYLDTLGDKESIKNLSHEERRHRGIVDENHITSNKKQYGYRDTLSKEVVSKIERRFNKDLVTLGYKLDRVEN